MTKSTSLTLAVAVATLTGLSAHAQSFIAYDNTTNFEGTKTSLGGTEVGDEINLTVPGGSTITQFQFEYFFNGTAGAAGGIVRMYAKDFTGNLQPGGNLKPGTVLFESQPFSLDNGFNTATIPDISVTVPANQKIIFTVAFTGVDGTENPGLLMYNGVGTDPDLPGQSGDFYWARNGLDWVQLDSNDPSIIDNLSARVIATPEPTTVALAVAGAAMLGMAARRRKS